MNAFNPSLVADGLSEMEFRELARFDDGHAGVFWSGAGGPSPWEMHPDCDEMLHVLDGAIEVEVLPSDGGRGEKVKLSKGAFFVVPRGCWHRQTMLVRTQEFYLTPGATLHSEEADPRHSEEADPRHSEEADPRHSEGADPRDSEGPDPR